MIRLMFSQKVLFGLVVFIFCLNFPLFVYAIDSDQDGLDDDMEKFVYYTDPFKVDTDGDGYSDFVEIEHDYSPHKGNGAKFHENDYDKDGLNDWQERWFKSDIGKADTDQDGINDFDEVMTGRKPNSADNSETFFREIVVDRTSQRLFFYVDGIKLVNMPVSTGNPGTETPAGEFAIQRMIPNKRYVGPGYDLPNVKWNMQFIPMYYIHGTYWHNDFGIRTHSHGCVNLSNKDAEFLYKYVNEGLKVRVIGETPKKYRVGT